MTIPDASYMSEGPVGYVVKRYPRFSETFIVNEILAHESAGLNIEIFALRPTVDTHFQNDLSRVVAPVNFLASGSVKSTAFWNAVKAEAQNSPAIWDVLAHARFATVGEVYQAIQLASHVRKRRIRHLHAHFATSATTVARLAARIAGISYSFTAHAKDIFHHSVQFGDLQSKIDDANLVITVSDFNLEYLHTHFGNYKKIVRVYNGLDLEKFDFQSDPGIGREIIAVGRLVEKKGFTHLVDACRILADKGIDFRCKIVGGGELETQLANQIRELKLEQWVEMTGPVPQSELRSLIRNATVMAAPCVVGEDGNRDGLPTVITESLALGTPCVATDVTGIPEIVRDQETGLIVKQGCSDQLAGSIIQMFANENFRASLASNGRRLIKDQFDIKTNAGRIRELFPVPASIPSVPSTQSAIGTQLLKAV